MKMKYKHSTDAVHFDNAKRIAYFKPYDPNDLYPPIVINNQEMIGYHHVSKDAIEDVAHEFNRDVRIIGIDHTGIAKSSLVENFIVRGKSYNFPKSNHRIPEGSWIVGIKMESDELWNAAKEGKIKGISPAGYYIDRYYDEMKKKWIVNKLNCKELSLVINKVPDNNTPMLYMHAEQGDENMTTEKQRLDLAGIINSKYEQVNSANKAKDDVAEKAKMESTDALTDTLSGLSENINQNTETLKQLDPNYEKKQAILERQSLVKTLQESNDPASKQILTQLQEQPIGNAPEPQIVSQGFDMNNLNTTGAAEGQDVVNKETFQGTNVPLPNKPAFEQKKSPDYFIDPDKHLEQQQKRQPSSELPKEIVEKANELDKEYETDRTLCPWDKFDRQTELAGQLQI